MSDELKQNRPLVLTAVFKALCDPERLEVIRDLINDKVGAERHCSSFSSVASMSRTARAHHFKVLRESGLIEHVNKGNTALAKLRREEIEKAYPGLLEILIST